MYQSYKRLEQLLILFAGVKNEIDLVFNDGLIKSISFNEEESHLSAGA